MKILLTGASGYVGSKIFQTLTKKGLDVYGTYHNHKIGGKGVKVDLTVKKEVQKLIEDIKPDIIIHTAADAHSKTCEADPEKARKINVDCTQYLVDEAKDRNIRFIFLSTFASFNPENTYGKTKYDAENIVSTLSDYVILRASMIIGVSPNTTSQNFFNHVLTSIKNREDIVADTSWEMEITCLYHLTQVVEALIETPRIKHVIIPIVTKGLTSRYQIAKDVTKKKKVKIISVDENRVVPLPNFYHGILTKLGLPESTYKDCIKQISEDIKSF